MIIAEMLYNLFPSDKEGDLSKKLVNLVCREALVEISITLGLGEYILLSDSEKSTGGQTKESNLENVLEALIGAIFIDSGIEIVKDFIYRNWYDIAKEVTDAPTNPKNIVQELAQGQKLPLPTYEIIERCGPDHSPLFKIKVVMGNYIGIGSAGNKKSAEQNAAKDLLDKMGT
jgi:ribonuclease-3